MPKPKFYIMKNVTNLDYDDVYIVLKSNFMLLRHFNKIFMILLIICETHLAISITITY